VKTVLAGVVIMVLVCALPLAALAERLSTEILIDQLDDPSENARYDAIEALGRQRAVVAVGPLLKVLGSKTATGSDKMAASYALGAIGDRRAVEPLIAALEMDMRQRTGILMAIIPALGMLKDVRAVPLLLKALNNREDDWLARNVAARALGSIGSTEAVPSLIRAAWLPDTRADAIGALGAIRDPRSIEVLISALQAEEEPEVIETAASGLVTLGSLVLPDLIRCLAQGSLEYPDESQRARIAQVLGDIGDPEAREALAQASRDTSPVVRESALEALDKLGQNR
jgi:HEAT repeat protein